ncbi:tether containing UBX domain for GLUT4 [Epargyreus clarus]|uniref:tether containing UBX domain for GLUT4 n=1 Tax=Epargyreus clarus TaxID=520877 RepID=UPI003C2B3573
MSRDIIILTPNGRRIKVQCTADTNILQVLEDVCVKQGFQSEEYDLKHHNKVLDLTTTVRFCNLPNKAMLEMVETEKKRVESNVVIGLHLEDGERKTGDFPSKTTLFDLISSLAPNQLEALKNPTIMYMRQEVIGIAALKEKTLRQLGLLTGRAILRLLDKAEEAMQANVSTFYRRQPDKVSDGTNNTGSSDQCKNPKPADIDMAGPSNVEKSHNVAKFDPIKLIKNEVRNAHTEKTEGTVNKQNQPNDTNKMDVDEVLEEKPRHSQDITKTNNTNNVVPCNTQENLERRLKIEDEVTFLGTHKAIVFMQPDIVEEDVCDLPDDFYELTIEEVRKIYHELQQKRIELENTPLITADKREELQLQTSQQKMNMYKNVVVRIQFPDNIILQGVFTPTNTIEDVTNFVKEYLQHPEEPFRIFTTPLKESLDPQTTLLAARFVPCVHMHFKWLNDNSNRQYLKDEVYSKKTSSDAASILASKYRAPSRRRLDDGNTSQKPNSGNKSKPSKVPKWFK